MTPRETHRDDARPLPQGPRSGSQHAPEDADDVYVVRRCAAAAGLRARERGAARVGAGSAR